MKRQRKKQGLLFGGILFFILALLPLGCQESLDLSTFEKEIYSFDPSKEAKITGFTPDSGGVGTQIVVYGENFGTDTSNIKVFVNDTAALLISSTGNSLYAVVPSQAGTGKVRVELNDGTDSLTVESGHDYAYERQYVVKSLSGFYDENNNTAIVDGDIDEAQFERPYWLAFDDEKNIYMLEEYRGMRFIDKDLTTVSTLWRTGTETDRPRTISFTPSYDTMAVTFDQNRGESSVAARRFFSDDGYVQDEAWIGSKQCNGGDFKPGTDRFFFNSYTNGEMFFWNDSAVSEEDHTADLLYRIRDVGWEFNVQFAPSGEFAYICVINQHYIMRAEYSETTGLLQTPSLFAGGIGQADYVDGVGVNARFNQPIQGCFDSEDNFYVCDRLNHCIRKITPEGVVTTFAGRPERADPKYGDTNGPLRDAQFDQPNGIIYDEEADVFYIADMYNFKIRMIVKE